MNIKRLKYVGQVVAIGRGRVNSVPSTLIGPSLRARYSRVSPSEYVGIRLVASPFDTFEHLTPSRSKRARCRLALLHFLVGAR